MEGELMRKSMRRALPGDSRGFSLIELLIAIAILGIVVVPLLHTFFTSAGTAAKSRKLGETTLVAQNVSELIDSTKMSQISALQVGSSLGSYSVSDFSALDPVYTTDQSGNRVWKQDDLHSGTATTAGKYIFTLNGIDGGKYKAIVTLDASTDYYDINSMDVTQYTPVGAVFDQTAGSDPDTASYAGFTMKAAALADVATGTSVALSCSRKISLNVSETEAGLCTYTCTYGYTCTATYTRATTGKQETQIWTDNYDYSFFNGSAQSDGSLPALYFFFNSYNSDYGASASDQITITHTGTSPLSVFLVCQGETYPNTVKAHIRLKDDSFINNQSLATKVYCNIPHGSYLFYIFQNQYWYISTTYSESLLSTEQQNRLYDVTIAVCASGSDTPIYTLKSTKLD